MLHYNSGGAGPWKLAHQFVLHVLRMLSSGGPLLLPCHMLLRAGLLLT
jgi:hypothetical protein